MKTVPVWIFGIGGVGGALLDILRDAPTRAGIQRRTGLDFVPVFLADSTSYVMDVDGLDEAALEGAVTAKRAGQSLAQGANGVTVDAASAALAALRRSHVTRWLYRRRYYCLGSDGGRCGLKR